MILACDVMQSVRCSDAWPGGGVGYTPWTQEPWSSRLCTSFLLTVTTVFLTDLVNYKLVYHDGILFCSPSLTFSIISQEVLITP